ncbi:MAG: hypothetical protein JSW11_00960 [Candidatus Heimdallarchaeota archaeon]|nr:MAG: hypothetical protein JSW11_00960 [Candidatus Heimdallarchaeota archaeon]
MNALDILDFQKNKKAIEKNGCFITVVSGCGHSLGSFVVGDVKHKKKWKSMLDKKNCPIGIFKSLEEATAFVIGFTVAKNKKWKY